MLNNLDRIIELAITEDIGPGDYTGLACIDSDAKGNARVLIKEKGILAGIELTQNILHKIDADLGVEILIQDGTPVKKGDIAMLIHGNVRSMLKAERLVLNFMQRMSGIATKTHYIVGLLHGLHTKVLDTRKTTPNMRYFEKWAVRIGGGVNHRFGLYDMMMIKDNHIDFAGSITKAIRRSNDFIQQNKLNIKIEIETRNLQEITEVLNCGGVYRILLDNFDIPELLQAVQLINGRFETEASGGITEANIRAVAETGVDFISVGALTHHIKSLDISLEAIK